MVIDEIFAYNEQFVKEHRLPIIGHAPRKRMAVVTCMDCRLVQYVRASPWPGAW